MKMSKEDDDGLGVESDRVFPGFSYKLATKVKITRFSKITSPLLTLLHGVQFVGGGNSL